MKRFLCLLCLALLPAQGGGQTAAPAPAADTKPGDDAVMTFEDYEPKSTLWCRSIRGPGRSTRSSTSTTTRTPTR